mmetsp:Transcript_13547/g.21121  ORF Transcript_13547/g.21121 Transcript_13547/m.21121 type:complete len:387 (+) Transcript_13547:1-1161(+)
MTCWERHAVVGLLLLTWCQLVLSFISRPTAGSNNIAVKIAFRNSITAMQCEAAANNMDELSQQSDPTKSTRRVFLQSSSSVLAIIASFSGSAVALPKTQASGNDLSWDFPKGSVKLEKECWVGDFKISNPRLVGQGGGGAVFSVELIEQRLPDGKTIPIVLKSGALEGVLKVSWPTTQKDIENEAKVIQILNDFDVPNVEQVLASVAYRDSSDRNALLMQPFVSGEIVGEISDLKDKKSQEKAVEALMKMMVRTLGASVAVADLQPLSQAATGRTLVVDLSEARALRRPASALDLALVQNFCLEAFTKVPDNLHPAALGAVERELLALSKEEKSARGNKRRVQGMQPEVLNELLAAASLFLELPEKSADRIREAFFPKSDSEVIYF